MCGIVGMFGATRGGRRIARAMCARIAHRGPDGAAVIAGSGYVLGHRRLAIIDVAGGTQPMVTADGRHAITFNGEIYNHREVRRTLERLGWTFRTRSDTEVLLAALAQWDVQALDRLNGMFAFAMCDTATGAWLLARDHFGIKPLYYTETPSGLVFASEIKALFEHPEVKREVDPQSLECYLTFQFAFDDETLFRGIHKLRPGQYMRGRGGEIWERNSYWVPNCALEETESPESVAARLRWLLGDSVRLQVGADVPVGTHLSGGVDSSAVTMLARRHLAPGFPAFCGRFADGPAFDEAHHARLVAGTAGADLTEVVPTAEDFVALMPRLIWHMDEPAAGPGLFPQFMVARAAARRVKVVLGGQGGDELFAGYARYLLAYLEQALKGAIQGTQEEGRHIVLLASIIPSLRALEGYVPMMQDFWRDGMFEPMDLRYLRLIDRSPQLDSLLTDELRQSFDRERLTEQYRAVFNDPRTPSYVNKMTLFDLRTLLPALLQIEDRVSMAVGLESRVPLLDHRIVDVALRTPPAIKFSGGRLKHLFREAVGGIVPAPILARQDKMGFPVPLKAWCGREPVRSFLGDILTSRACRERGLFKTEAIPRLIGDDGVAGRQIWGALCLELWHRAFLDGPCPTPDPLAAAVPADGR